MSRSVNHDHRRWLHHGGSSQRSRKTRILFDTITKEEFPSCRMGWLDPSLHHSLPYQGFNLPVPAPDHWFTKSCERHVCTHWVYGSFQLRLCIFVYRSLPAVEGILGCGGQWVVFLESSGGVNSHCPRGYAAHVVVKCCFADYSRAVLSIFTDLVCAALPCIFLRNVQIGRKTKIGLCILMSLGVM